MKVLFAAIALVLAAPVLSHSASAGEFHWCRSVAETPVSELIASKVPQLPKNYSTASHFQKDGEWDYNLPIQDVWTLYTTTPMKKMWASHYIVHRFSLAPGSEVQESEETTTAGIHEGTRMFLDIKALLTGSVCNMAIGFQVTQVIPLKVIQLEYLDFSPPYGTQWMYFEKLSDTKTRVVQFSQYLGKDEVIDHFYSYFHNEEIPRLHRRLQALAAKQQQK